MTDACALLHTQGQNPSFAPVVLLDGPVERTVSKGGALHWMTTMIGLLFASNGIVESPEGQVFPLMHVRAVLIKNSFGC